MYLLLCASHFKSQRCYVVRYVVHYVVHCEFKSRMVSAPTGPFPNLYLDLSRHLHCLLCMQISPSDPQDHVMIRSMCSILGMNTIVTMVCYCMCLSLIFQSLTLLTLFTYCILFKYFIFSLK